MPWWLALAIVCVIVLLAWEPGRWPWERRSPMKSRHKNRGFAKTGRELLLDPKENWIPNKKRDLDAPTVHMKHDGHGGQKSSERAPPMSEKEWRKAARSELQMRLEGVVKQSKGPQRPFRDVATRTLLAITSEGLRGSKAEPE